MAALILRQLAREEPDITESDRADLVRAFCTSSIRWHLPVQSWRGPGLWQYQPPEFSRVPKSATEPGYMAHATTKNLDNCWLIGGADDAVWWFIEGPDENWNRGVLRLLDSCLARMTYFGRAESITLMKRSTGEMKHLELNCSTTQLRTSRSVPVLFPAPEATLADVERSTDDPAIAKATVPRGAVCFAHPSSETEGHGKGYEKCARQG